jgi:hypothetical protein
MRGPRARLHLPYDQWPAADRRLWEQAVNSDDPFGDTAGVRLAKASLHTYLFGWRRFLGFLAVEEFSSLELDPGERLNIERVRRFVLHLAETNTPVSVAAQVDAVYKAARIMMPERGWTWLRDHFWRSTMLQSLSKPTTWNEFLPISIQITVSVLLRLWDMGVLLVFGAPCQIRRWRGRSTAGPSH